MRINFQEKDPDEWKLVYPFLEGGINFKFPELPAATIAILVPWFHELFLTELLQECDQGLSKEKFVTMKFRYNEFIDVYCLTILAIKYGLKQTQQKLVDYLMNYWYDDAFSHSDVKSLRLFLIEYPSMWDFFCANGILPRLLSSFDETSRKECMESPIFDHVCFGVKRKLAWRRRRRRNTLHQAV